MKRLFLVLFAVFMLTSAEAQKQPVYARSSIRCMGVELDGSQTLRVQGYGRNRSDAKEQAMKNAVWAVIFDGIRDGVEGCNMKPLVTEVNAKERYEDYFNLFLEIMVLTKSMCLYVTPKKVLGVVQKTNWAMHTI